uniref:Uncharacterized protein n=1 Tax=Gadus morhua TaxID=8049 RepID=A0A8C5AXE0_GADMO
MFKTKLKLSIGKKTQRRQFKPYLERRFKKKNNSPSYFWFKPYFCFDMIQNSVTNLSK